VKRLIWWALGAVALYFALQGGEYSTRDLFVLRSRTAKLTQQVDSLQRQVDSLGRFLRLVKSDSATQERIAREEFGMVRGDKEIIYG
jgi:cell division protein FtsB